MAFCRSKVLKHVQRYSVKTKNPVDLSPANLQFDAARYSTKYSSTVARVGYEQEGMQFTWRIPRYRGIHPEIKDRIDAQRTFLLLWVAGVLFFMPQAWELFRASDKTFSLIMFSDKGFIGRYAYKEKEIEYGPLQQARVPV